MWRPCRRSLRESVGRWTRSCARILRDPNRRRLEDRRDTRPFSLTYVCTLERAMSRSRSTANSASAYVVSAVMACIVPGAYGQTFAPEPASGQAYGLNRERFGDRSGNATVADAAESAHEFSAGQAAPASQPAVYDK